MSPVTSLVLLLAFSYGSTFIAPDTEERLPIREKPGTCPVDVDFPRCDNPAISFPPECETDRDCKGKSKCCFSGCRNRCLLPLQDKFDSCPYFNHSICVLVKPTPSECQSDGQCQGTERCCCLNCHRQCTPTVKVKPGQCPAPKKLCSKIDSAKCKTDSNCIENQKCCDRCGLKCVTPEQEHDGVCPTSMENLSCLTFYKTLCNRDSDCPLEQKCCLSDNVLQCQEVKKEKPGSCPIPVTRCKPPTPKPLCTSDRDCPGDKKCCTPLCGQTCTDLNKNVKPGTCPPPRTRCPGPPKRGKCKVDRDCKGGDKCCEKDCVLECINLKNTKDKPGHCPTFNTLVACKTPYSHVECRADHECSGDKKCCDYECQMQCKKPQ